MYAQKQVPALNLCTYWKGNKRHTINDKNNIQYSTVHTVYKTSTTVHTARRTTGGRKMKGKLYVSDVCVHVEFCARIKMKGKTLNLAMLFAYDRNIINWYWDSSCIFFLLLQHTYYVLFNVFCRHIFHFASRSNAQITWTYRTLSSHRAFENVHTERRIHVCIYIDSICVSLSLYI